MIVCCCRYYCLFQVGHWTRQSCSGWWLRSLGWQSCGFRYYTATYWPTGSSETVSLSECTSANSSWLKTLTSFHFWSLSFNSVLFWNIYFTRFFLFLFALCCSSMQKRRRRGVGGGKNGNVSFCVMDDLCISWLGIASANKPDLTLPCAETSGMPQRRDQRPAASLDSICAKHAQQAQERLSSTFQSSSSALAVFVSHQLFLLRRNQRSKIQSLKKKQTTTCDLIVLKPNENFFFLSQVLISLLDLRRLIDLFWLLSSWRTA